MTRAAQRFEHHKDLGGMTAPAPCANAVTWDHVERSVKERARRWKREKEEVRQARKLAKDRAKVTLPTLKFMQGDDP